MSTHHLCRVNCGGTACPAPVRHLHEPTARELHDAHLDADSGFARVLNGNAVERHVPRRRRRHPNPVRRALHALLRWLASPSPWSTRP